MRRSQARGIAGYCSCCLVPALILLAIIVAAVIGVAVVWQSALPSVFRSDDGHHHHYNAYRDGVVRLMRDHFPHGMAVKMLLKPLGLNPLVGRAMLPAITSATRLFVRRYNGIQ